MIKNILVAAVIGAAAAGAQAAAPNLVENGSFDGTTTTYVYNGTPSSVASAGVHVPVKTGTVVDWSGSFVSIASNSSAWNTPSGKSGFDAATQGGWVAGLQADGTLSQALTLGEGEYTLSWLTSNRGASQEYGVYFNGVKIDDITTKAGSGWITESVTFTTLTGGTGLSFVGETNFATKDATSFIDNVSVSVVPEPTALLMMALGTLGLLAWRRRAHV